ncbi:MAG: ribonuclease P protein component [Acholeplasmataceae bacterium]|jgi:ribonuclease P protein component|nr:ribonuclease P protein component [Acholeplasmataceae bacterium]
MNRKYSLKKNRDIEKLIQAKHSVGNKYYAIYYQSGDLKIAVSPSRKIKSAVARNYEKRVAKEILRPLLPNLSGITMLLIIKNTVQELSFIEKKDQIEFLIKKIIKEKK